mmetsp:Transcript_21651/g.32388  ORF Transcript_21651/g.32388 Transcript_21651/m.32388 type:complete len:307 (-) Transcript_21651:172-1092(-)|eukprot:CAMPEP_0206453276 /NCGR_PEP_ID=MMETSP0324_2-20121206/20451_1 /ASSEMBLY_ACC=CAM_ASM_000836 /TAXON_ID=2866 /ORGANISM="Crypthecodinium cohnii, Strain Seligo" /LENGTH=306 /DNA_ID=CAMNT_0053923539 /DNA_START=90 /DNA_END=1010 /DNA_ORIENTATION=+
MALNHTGVFGSDPAAANPNLLAAIYSTGVGFNGIDIKLSNEGLTPELPNVFTWQFFTLCIMSLVGPYIFCCVTYIYHFSKADNKEIPRMRTLAQDIPKPEYRYDWKTALTRPEGISAVVAWIVFTIVTGPLTGVFDIVPPAIKDLTPTVKPLVLLAYFLVFDLMMWCIHCLQHYWPWLYHHTHDQHHLIKSPTIVVALTGYLPDTCLLIIVPLHATQWFVPCGNFVTIFAFASISLWHLHMIHSEFPHPWDPYLYKLGLVSTHDHHVHHLRPKKNLAHFFVMYDKMFGTYVDPASLSQLVSREKLA